MTNSRIALDRSVAAGLRKQLESTTTEVQRSDLLRELVDIVYGYVKLQVPMGGLDGHDGPERLGIGDVQNAAVTHQDNALNRPASRPTD